MNLHCGKVNLEGKAKAAVFLDRVIGDHRIIVFPAWIRASLVGEPVAIEDYPDQTLASTPQTDTPPLYYKTGISASGARKRVSRLLAELAERLA